MYYYWLPTKERFFPKVYYCLVQQTLSDAFCENVSLSGFTPLHGKPKVKFISRETISLACLQRKDISRFRAIRYLIHCRGGDRIHILEMYVQLCL